MVIVIAKLILQPFRHFTYVTTHSPTLPSRYLHHNSFSNPSVASPTSQFILQPFFRFSYVTSSSLNSPGEPPMAFVEYFFFKLKVLRKIIYIFLPILNKITPKKKLKICFLSSGNKGLRHSERPYLTNVKIVHM